jgi:hypothetical protein
MRSLGPWLACLWLPSARSRRRLRCSISLHRPSEPSRLAGQWQALQPEADLNAPDVARTGRCGRRPRELAGLKRQIC